MIFPAAARAACIRFEETALGEANLVNSCDTPMNVFYCVKGKNSALARGRGLSRCQARRLLRRGGKPPVQGTCEIGVLSCVASSSLVFRAGLPPSCSVDSADAG